MPMKPFYQQSQSKPVTEQEAYLKLSTLCAQAEHCSSEMTDKMTRWQVPEEQQARVMQRLVSEKFIDDARYCGFFIRDKIRYNNWGRRKIEQALRMKRIDSSVYGPQLAEVDDAMYVEMLRPLLAAKRKTLKAKSDYELNCKLIRFAMGRGFDMDIIEQCL